MKKTNALRLLDQYTTNYELVEYTYDPNNLSIEAIANNCNLPVAQIFKTLVGKGDKTGVLIAVVSGDKQLNFKKLAAISGNKKMTLVAVKNLQNLTGYIRGGCSPLGMKKKFPIYVDEVVERFEKIYVNAGKRGLLVGLSPNDLKTITEAAFENIAD